jgi:hypothetical protein
MTAKIYKRVERLNLMGLNYREWHKEVDHLLTRNYNTSIAEINSEEETAIR